MAKVKIVVVGSSNTDMIVSLDRLPGAGETRLGGEFQTAAGGKGANQAVSAARAGANVTFIARLGNDVFGKQALAGFVRDRIDVTRIVRDPVQPSGVALIMVAGSGQNCIAVAGGANHFLSVADIQKNEAVIASAKIILTQLETPLPTVRALLALAAKKKIPVILNPAPAQALSREILRNVSILTPNEIEAFLLTGVRVTSLKTARQAADILRSRGARQVILTLGKRGAWVATDDVQLYIPGLPVKAVDTTAAGDVFNGALAVGLAEGKPLIEAVRFANGAAALSVMKMGAQTSIPMRREVEQFLAKRSP